MPEDANAVYTNSPEGNALLRRQMDAAQAYLRRGESLQDYAARRPEIVRDSVSKIIRRLEGVDAFDVIELMRNREVMAARMGYEEERTPASPKTLEIVATALLARGARTVGPAARPDAGSRATEMLHLVGAEIGTVGLFSTLASATASGNPWARLAAAFRLARLSIRNLHYRSIDDALNRRLFGQGPFGEELSRRMGFTWDEFDEVRAAILDDYSDGLFGAMDALAEGTRGFSGAVEDFAPEERERMRGLLSSVMTNPGARASFTVADIADQSGMPADTVRRILELFSVGFEATDPVAAVEEFLNGMSPFADAALVHDGAGNYLQLGLEVGDDNYRQVMERSLGRDAIHTLYNEHRRDVSEATAGEFLRHLLQVAPAASAYYYYAPKDGFTASDLGREAKRPSAVGKECEGDLLFLIDDVAICVEVKGASFSPGARSTRSDYFENEVTKTIGAGAYQARRVADLVSANGGLWMRDRTWLDLSVVREVRTIVVTLDDLGPLGSEIVDLDAAGVLSREEPPWVVSSYDLAIIADLFDDAAEFLLYLRRRTDPETATRWRVVDELDLVMLFFHLALEHQPDPARVRVEYPAAPAPGPDEQMLWDDQPREARVHDYTTTMLNPWYDYVQGDGPAVPKPRLVIDPDDVPLHAAFTKAGVVGETVARADLIGLTVAQRHDLHVLIEEGAAAAKAGRATTSRLSLAGSSGAGAIVVRSAPGGFSYLDVASRLTEDLISTVAEWSCDRVLGFVASTAGRPALVGYHSTTVEAYVVRSGRTSGPPPSPKKKKRSVRRRPRK